MGHLVVMMDVCRVMRVQMDGCGVMGSRGGWMLSHGGCHDCVSGKEEEVVME